MADISYDNLCPSEFFIVSAEDKVQDINLNQLKLKVSDSYNKDEKITTSFEPSDYSDVVNKAYLDTKLSKMEGHLSFSEKITMNLYYTTINNL